MRRFDSWKSSGDNGPRAFYRSTVEPRMVRPAVLGKSIACAVVIGHALRPNDSPEEARRHIQYLGRWLEDLDQKGMGPVTAKIPPAS